MQNGRFNIVVDGQHGSTGKGAVASHLAWKNRPEILSTTNFPNAGHTSVYVDGSKFVAKMIPSPAILNKWVDDYNPLVVIGAGAAFNIDRLMEEIKECNIEDKIYIHPRAGVVTEEHKKVESGDSELSTKHIASTMQGCAVAACDKIMRKPTTKLARDYKEITSLVYGPYKQFPGIQSDIPMPLALQKLMKFGMSILHEGSQGFSLDINHGSHYPQCTSRSTTAMQNMADMGVPTSFVGDIYLVIRPYPIRVGNVVEDGNVVGNSGGCYSDNHEITWADVARDSGMPPNEAEALYTRELTTVTKRIRRVFSFSIKQVQEAVAINGANNIVLNFANYIDYSIYGQTGLNELPQKIKDFIRKIEDACEVPVTMIGTGPQVDHFIYV